MAGIKISNMPAAVSAQDTDQIEVNQGGVSKRLTLYQVRETVLGGDGVSATASLAAGNLSIGIDTFPADNEQPVNVRNTAIGIHALALVTNVGEMTAVGYNAGALYTGGNGATAVGEKALANDQVGPYQTAVGSHAGMAIRNTAGGGNTAIGHGAMGGDDFTPAFATGSYNTALGGWAGQELTSGGGNTLVGMQAGVNLTTGGQNVFVGIGAGPGGSTSPPPSAAGNAATNNVGVGAYALSSTTADQGTAVGFWALKASVSGANNTALGFTTLMSSTADVNNTAVGWAAMQNTNGGSNNTAIGTRALTGNIDGTYNVAVGGSALAANLHASNLTAVGSGALEDCTAASNTAFGAFAAKDTTIGTNNVAVGDFALAANMTGVGNTIVGSNAASAMTAFSNVTALGWNATPTASHQVVLGNSSVTTNLFWGELQGPTATFSTQVNAPRLDLAAAFPVLALREIGTNITKYFGNSGGSLVILNNDFSVNLLILTDAGDMAVAKTVTSLAATAVGAGAATQAFIKASSTANLGIYYGTGDPTFNAAKGSLYSKTDATTTTTRLWVNTTGSTTWATITTSA